jgi:hypothetical protein
MLESTFVRRFFFAIVVGTLCSTVSGVSALAIDEPCSGLELPANGDDLCPPSCLTCGCCAQAAEPALVVARSSPDAPRTKPLAFPSSLPRINPLEILHVPKQPAV